MVFVWCQSINPFLRYGNVNIWRKWPWRSRSIDPIFNRVLKGPKIHILCENGDSRSNPWRVIAQTSSNLRKSVSLSPKWPWRSRSIDPIFNRVLKGPKIHILCENGDSRSNPWRVIAQTSSSYRQTDGQTEPTTIPLRPLRPRGKNCSIIQFKELFLSGILLYLYLLYSSFAHFPSEVEHMTHNFFHEFER